jgi:DNA-binding PadR family transcriptional regulator
MKYQDPGISEREAAVLGLLCERPLYGYTIEKIIEERGMRYWTKIGFSSIYYVLKRLEGRGLITSTCEQQETGPSRRIYTITPAGRRDMEMAVRGFLSTYTRNISAFDLGIANLTLLPPKDVTSSLKKRLGMIDKAVSIITLGREERYREGRPYYVIALFDRALAQIRAERDWVTGFIRVVQENGHADEVPASGVTKHRTGVKETAGGA